MIPSHLIFHSFQISLLNEYYFIMEKVAYFLCFFYKRISAPLALKEVIWWKDVMHSYSPNTCEAAAGWYCEASLRYIAKPCFKETNKLIFNVTKW